MSIPTYDVKSKRTQRLRGTIYGHCMGDAVGLLSEFMVESEAQKYYGKHRGNIQYSHKYQDKHRERWLNGDWTDDSDQMIIIMQSLIANKGQVVPSDIAVRFHNWMTKGFPELGDTGGMGIGATTFKVMHHPAFKTDPHSASLEVWERNGRNIAPNGGVMRTSVVGLFMFHDLEAVIRNTRDVCKVTHADPRCQASCVATTVAIALMMQAAQAGVKTNLLELINTAYRHASECIQEDHEDAGKLEELKKHLFAPTLKDLNLTEYKKIGFTYKCVGAGFWALRQSDTTKSPLVLHTFRSAIEEIMFAAGDADTNGAVAGALLGCELGAHRLPDEWTAFPHKQWLDAIINEFMQLIDRTTPGNPVNIPGQITAQAEADNSIVSAGVGKAQGWQGAAESHVGRHYCIATKAPSARLQSCGYMKLCEDFLKTLELNDVFFNRAHDMCYCKKCLSVRNDEHYYERGSPPKSYGLPIGWYRFGLKMPPQAVAKEVFKEWHRAFHGTQRQFLKKMLKVGELAVPGRAVGKWTLPFLNTKQVFLSPSIHYAGSDAYAKPHSWTHQHKTYSTRVAFQVLIAPKSYKVGKETFESPTQIDPYFDNMELEWSPNKQDSNLLYGLLVKVD